MPILIASGSKQIEKEGKPLSHEDTAVSLAKGIVLLVEDYEPNILVASTFLETLGYEYEFATDGSQAFEKIKAKVFDVVLMDIQMPGMNGFEVTRAIRNYEKIEGRRPAFIIGVTAHAMAGDRERCISEGMDDYMSKPYSMSELKSILQKVSRISGIELGS
ncbi:MAG: response regulator [Alphaproteobacteria bacterium]